MVNGLGVLGWGVGGIEAEAAMLGQPVSMLIPEVVGFKLTGKLREGVTATDLVLTVTQMLRKKGVVGKFVEFYGAGPCRACRWPTAPPSANMAPEYGATCGFFPIDDGDARTTCSLTGRAEAADRAGRGLCQGAGHVPRPTRRPEPVFTDRRWNSTSPASVPSRSPGRSVRRTASSLPTRDDRLRHARPGRRPTRRPATPPARYTVEGQELRSSATATW